MTSANISAKYFKGSILKNQNFQEIQRACSKIGFTIGKKKTKKVVSIYLSDK